MRRIDLLTGTQSERIRTILLEDIAKGPISKHAWCRQEGFDERTLESALVGMPDEMCVYEDMGRIGLLRKDDSSDSYYRPRYKATKAP